MWGSYPQERGLYAPIYHRGAATLSVNDPANTQGSQSLVLLQISTRPRLTTGSIDASNIGWPFFCPITSAKMNFLLKVVCAAGRHLTSPNTYRTYGTTALIHFLSPALVETGGLR